LGRGCEDRAVVPDSLHDFFVASASVAGALIGLLFVAISVASDRLSRAEAGGQLHRVRALAAFTAFTNTLAVSLFALIPGHSIGPAAMAVSIAGLVFVLAALLSLVRRHQLRPGSFRDGGFLLALVVIFVVQLIQGIRLSGRPDDTTDVSTLAILVVVCFLLGIARAWELAGGPSIGLGQEVRELLRSQRHSADDPADEQQG
jgi:hypothetical protein